MEAWVDFQGDCRRARSVGSFTLTEAVYGAEDSLPLHAHANSFFALLLNGSYTEKLERGERRCAPFSLAYYPAGIPHADHFHGHGGRAFLVEVSAIGLEGVHEGGKDDSGWLGEVRGGRLSLLALRLYAAFSGGDETGDLMAEELGVEMVGELRGIGFPREGRKPGWLPRVVERIHDDFGARIRVAELATAVGVHPVYLTRVFRSHFGCGVGEYLQRVRTHHACSAMVSSDETLSSLAARLGYADQAHFTRRFRDTIGVTPGRFRALVSA